MCRQDEPAITGMMMNRPAFGEDDDEQAWKHMSMPSDGHVIHVVLMMSTSMFDVRHLGGL